MRTLFTGLTPPQADWVHTPLIEIAAVGDDGPLREAARRVGSYDYVVFTSRYAVRAFVPLVPAGAWTGTTRVVSIGPVTTRALAQAGIAGAEQVERDDSYGVVSWFGRQQPGRVLMPRSSLALPLIPDGLRRLGYSVDTVTAYQNRMPAHPQRVDLAQIDRIVFTSPSTVDNFVRLYGQLPADKVCECRGAVTRERLQHYINQT